MAVLREELNANTSGGTFTANTWVRRNLNFLAPGNNGFVTLHNNTDFILQPGTYFIRVSAPAFHVGYHVIRLWNETNQSVIMHGRVSFSQNQSSYPYMDQTESDMSGIITVNAITTYAIQHRCTTTASGNGLGVGNLAALGVTGTQQTLTIVEIIKLN
jgi:hypothetical protein